MKTPNYTDQPPKWATVFPSAFKGLPLNMIQTRSMAWRPAKEPLQEYVDATASPKWLTVTFCAAVVLMIVAQFFMKL
jgi:hypothetical protein